MRHCLTARAVHLRSPSIVLGAIVGIGLRSKRVGLLSVLPAPPASMTDTDTVALALTPPPEAVSVSVAVSLVVSESVKPRAGMV